MVDVAIIFDIKLLHSVPACRFDNATVLFSDSYLWLLDFFHWNCLLMNNDCFSLAPYPMGQIYLGIHARIS